MTVMPSTFTSVYHWLQRPPGKYLAAGIAVLILLALLCAGLAWSDYRTNWIARRLGAFLADTNHLRPQTGKIWKQLLAQKRTRKNIAPGDLPLKDMQTGLPDPVRSNRYQLTRIPELGAPDYIELWKTPLPGVAVDDRALDDITTSLRVYKNGLALVEALDLPDVQFYARVRAQVDQMYAQLGNIDTLTASDSLTTVDGDTLAALAPDSIKAAVFSELADQIIPGLKQKAEADVVRDYKAGKIAQLILRLDLGRYRGELYRDNDPAPVAFDIGADAVARILNVPQPDTSAESGAP